MTINNQASSVSYRGNGVLTSFTYNFLIPYQVDGVTPAVAVYLIDDDDVETLLLPTEYTISGVDDKLGGAVAYPLTGSPLTSATRIRIDRALSYIQADQFPNQGFLPQTIEQLADSLTMMIQQVAAALGVNTATSAQKEAFAFALTDESTEITSTGVYVTYIWPYDFTIQEVIGSLTHESTSGTFTMTVKVQDVNILSTPITLAVGETSSLVAATPPVVSLPNVVKGQQVTFEILGAGTGVKGAKVSIVGVQA